MNNNSSKQILLSVIGVAILVVAVVGVSFAFFSYLGTETNNTVETGTIIFNSTTTAMTLENVFPTTVANAETASVSVTGETTYEQGIDFKVQVTEVKSASDTIVPTVTITPVAQTGVTFTEATSTATTYNATSPLAAKTVLEGTIAPNTAVNGEILTIAAYYSSAEYHITDYEGDKQDLVDNGLLDTVEGKTFVTTEDWNALTTRAEDGSVTTPAYSFKILVTATEGAE